MLVDRGDQLSTTTSELIGLWKGHYLKKPSMTTDPKGRKDEIEDFEWNRDRRNLGVFTADVTLQRNILEVERGGQVPPWMRSTDGS